MASRILSVLNQRKAEAEAGDLSRMAWLAIHLGQESVAIDYVRTGLTYDPDNHYLVKLSQKLHISNL